LLKDAARGGRVVLSDNQEFERFRASGKDDHISVKQFALWRSGVYSAVKEMKQGRAALC
jgi:hypothetical protein